MGILSALILPLNLGLATFQSERPQGLEAPSIPQDRIDKMRIPYFVSQTSKTSMHATYLSIGAQ